MEWFLQMLKTKKFLTKEQQEQYARSIKGRYLTAMKKNSFVYFGIPFFAIMLAGTYFLTQFASLRYEQHDQKTSEINQKAQLDLSGKRRKVDINEEFYRLQQLDTTNWEQKRVKRLEGESENKW